MTCLSKPTHITKQENQTITKHEQTNTPRQEHKQGRNTHQHTQANTQNKTMKHKTQEQNTTC